MHPHTPSQGTGCIYVPQNHHPGKPGISALRDMPAPAQPPSLPWEHRSCRLFLVSLSQRPEWLVSASSPGSPSPKRIPGGAGRPPAQEDGRGGRPRGQEGERYGGEQKGFPG